MKDNSIQEMEKLIASQMSRIVYELISYIVYLYWLVWYLLLLLRNQPLILFLQWKTFIYTNTKQKEIFNEISIIKEK